MWPFARNDKMKVTKIAHDFAVTGQILPEQIQEIATLGYRAIVCARPDNEQAGQPTFADIEAAARRLGLKAVHVPMSGGTPSPDQAACLRQALRDAGGPVLGYCRSGMRAANLYAAASR